ncbi:MAG: acyl-CoA dehydrogenase [Caulobacter sp.]|nr:acyl-CoA dehydrogenase [Caulobacter sp.]
MTYQPPIRDLALALKAAGFERLADAYPEADAATVEAVLDGAGAFAAEVVAPLNRPGDQAGATYANGVVTAAPGYAEALRQFAQGGWNSLSAEPEHGGQGLPKALEIAVFEMFNAASLAFGLCPILTQGAIEAIAAHGTDRQKALYLPRMVSGEWTGTMNLTEPQAGSDLAALTTRAEPDGEGGWRLTGQKIFITWGDHDAADNIVHLVLARTPNAPAGVKGISLFLAPKRLLDADGEPAAANDLRPAGIEHKLGIHASPTCVMAFEGAKAELVGVEGQGLAHMFTMMNAARLQVGTQGVAIAERAYQQALAFSHERRQSRSAWTGESPAPLWDLPDVRRTLMLIKAKTAAARGVCLATAVAADLGRHGDAAAKLREELLTPIAKGWSTDVGVWAASEALQVHGGMGFVEETGAAQHYRDCRILPIYEGTNGIQAIDLIGRKLTLADGEAFAGLIAEMRQTATALEGGLEAVGAALNTAVAAMETAGGWLAERRGTPDALAGATAFLRLCGETVGGWMLARQAQLEARMAPLAALYAGQVLSGVPGQVAAVMQGAAPLEAFEG